MRNFHVRNFVRATRTRDGCLMGAGLRGLVNIFHGSLQNFRVRFTLVYANLNAKIQVARSFHLSVLPAVRRKVKTLFWSTPLSSNTHTVNSPLKGYLPPLSNGRFIEPFFIWWITQSVVHNANPSEKAGRACWAHGQDLGSPFSFRRLYSCASSHGPLPTCYKTIQ